MHVKSLLSRIVLLHIVAVAIAAVFLPLVLFWLLTSEIDHLHRDAMQDQADALSERLAQAADGTLQLNLTQSQRDLYSAAYGRYEYDVRDASGQVLFSSRADGSAILPAGASSAGSMSGARVTRTISDRVLRVEVAEDLAHRDVITDDIAANFFRRVGWITIPILLSLLAIDIVIFRRALAPLLRASQEASRIGPARTDIRLPTDALPAEIRPLVLAVNQALDRLEDGFRMQRQFTADAAHQLRTPLAVLRTRIETKGQSAGRAELLADIARMSRIVHQLLEIAELDTLALDPDEIADLHAVCTEVVAAIAPFALAQGKDIALKGADTPVHVHGNAVMLERAIFNLAENAIKYTAPRTSVEVEIGAGGAVWVRDRGPGIRPSERGFIFQRFWRGDTRDTEGAGLGLSIVRAVIEDHGASIMVGDLAGGGTEFSLRFRPAPAPSAAA
ncbi:putative two-component system histidine kinase (QseC-like) [Bradyrhizobium sp. ORS 278]|uniref:sensor histidine kinase n=1 Tax=Bradyrhizobium sp. (strain ORS 278) TaxID=114615 RepID=UPI0001508269|nr:ATP-binding protein [Bradyrhizobium sp. ORS 278]CAL78456.1 putative two-component system histidine kinase (QseC-like) [Bradyrhizobium sp. ORS 278]